MNQKHHTHKAHPSKSQETASANIAPEARPANILAPESPEVRKLLEQLDDVVYAAIGGSQAALEQARMLWPQTREAIGWRRVEDSRNEYLRYAIAVSRELDGKSPRTPERMLASLEVISLLTRMME